MQPKEINRMRYKCYSCTPNLKAGPDVLAGLQTLVGFGIHPFRKFIDPLMGTILLQSIYIRKAWELQS